MRLMMWIATVAALAATTPVKADWAFDVNVDVKSLHPNAKAVGVACDVCQGSCQGKIQTFASGSWQQDVPMTSPRNFKGVARVNVSAAGRSAAEVAKVTDYQCKLYIQSNSGGNAMPASGPLPPWATPQPGTELKNILSGKIK